MIERTFDAGWFNQICNSPEVRPWLRGEGEIDLTPIISDRNNYALRAKGGGFILIAAGAGFYSAHTQFASEGRGANAVAAMHAGLQFMFTRTDCMRIYTHCPDDNAPARNLCEAGGFRYWFRSDHDPLYGRGDVMALDVLEWMTKAPGLSAEGKAFHDLLEAAKKHADSPLPIHDDDDAHDAAVGAVALMCKRGQARKGVALYNLWAGAAGYAPIRLLSDGPPVVDVVDAIMGLTPAGELEVRRLCQ